MQPLRTATPPAGRLFSIVAMIEAFTWAGLLAGPGLPYAWPVQR